MPFVILLFGIPGENIAYPVSAFFGLLSKVFAANRKQFQSVVVQQDVKLAFHRDAADHTTIAISAISVSFQADLDDILAIRRKVVTNRNSATRSERKIFAHAAVLHQRIRY